VILPRRREDERPFATEGTGGTDVSRAFGGEALAHIVDGDVKNRFKRRVQEWATLRSMPIVDSHIAVEASGVTARVPLYAITEQTAVVLGTAAQPVTMTMTIEPASWSQRLFSRLGKGAFTTGDGSFDRAWRVTTTDANATGQLLDAECRELLRDVGCWCRLTYTDGEIEVRLDDEKLAGLHVLGGIETVLRLAHARINTAAYR
jgi:hypothetical protein